MRITNLRHVDASSPLKFSGRISGFMTSSSSLDRLSEMTGGTENSLPLLAN